MAKSKPSGETFVDAATLIVDKKIVVINRRLSRIEQDVRRLRQLVEVISKGEYNLEDLPPIACKAIGWTWGRCCQMLEDGMDPRKYEIPTLLSEAIVDLQSELKKEKTNEA